MNKVIITGAAGFVGAAVVKECLSKGIFVYAVDIVENPSSRLDLSNKNLVYRKLDIFNKSDFLNYFKDKKIDTIFHFAWIGSAGPLRTDINCQINNAKMSVELLKSAKDIGCKKFVCAGSIMEFEALEVVYAQNSKPQESFIYGIGKQLAHSLCKIISNKIDIELVWAYITNTFGVGEASPRLINTTIKKCIYKEPLQFTSGVQNYDFIYIDDVAHAFYLLGLHGINNKAYVIGSGNAGPLRRFLEELVYICYKEAKPIFGDIPFTGVNLDISVFSTHEIEKDCGFKPKVSFKEGIKKTHKWILEQEQKQ
jgi:nucleoside-diphosphate-sugar epimerase